MTPTRDDTSTACIEESVCRENDGNSGSNYYWIDYRGKIARTEAYTRPHIDYRELIGL